MLGVHNQFLIIVAVTAFEENDVLLQGRHQENFAHREDIDEDNNMSPRPDTTPDGFDLVAEDRCVWSQEGVNQYIGGCSKNCEYFDTVQKAMSACNAEMTCGGVTYQKGGSSPRGGFQLRSGGSLRKSPSNETSWLCQDRCVWSQEVVNQYIGGCSKNCEYFDTAQKAMSACNAEMTCGGVTYQKGGSSPLGGFQLRSGGSVRKSPSNETSWVCQRPTAPTLAPLGYVHMPHQCVLGKNIVKYANKSVGQCADLCNEDRTCEGFEYGVAYGGAGVYQPADCQLDSSADTTDCDGRHYNLDFYSKAFVQPGLSTQGWRIWASTTTSGWAWDVKRVKFIADGAELQVGPCKVVESAHVDVSGYGPENAFSDGPIWGGRKMGDEFFLGLECTAPPLVQVKLNQGCGHAVTGVGTAVKIQKKVGGNWIDAGVNENTACDQEVTIFPN